MSAIEAVTSAISGLAGALAPCVMAGLAVGLPAIGAYLALRLFIRLSGE